MKQSIAPTGNVTPPQHPPKCISHPGLSSHEASKEKGQDIENSSAYKVTEQGKRIQDGQEKTEEATKKKSDGIDEDEQDLSGFGEFESAEDTGRECSDDTDLSVKDSAEVTPGNSLSTASGSGKEERRRDNCSLSSEVSPIEASRTAPRAAVSFDDLLSDSEPENENEGRGREGTEKDSVGVEEVTSKSKQLAPAVENAPDVLIPHPSEKDSESTSRDALQVNDPDQLTPGNEPTADKLQQVPSSSDVKHKQKHANVDGTSDTSNEKTSTEMVPRVGSNADDRGDIAIPMNLTGLIHKLDDGKFVLDPSAVTSDPDNLEPFMFLIKNGLFGSSRGRDDESTRKNEKDHAFNTSEKTGNNNFVDLQVQAEKNFPEILSRTANKEWEDTISSGILRRCSEEVTRQVKEMEKRKVVGSAQPSLVDQMKDSQGHVCQHQDLETWSAQEEAAVDSTLRAIRHNFRKMQKKYAHTSAASESSWGFLTKKKSSSKSSKRGESSAALARARYAKAAAVAAMVMPEEVATPVKKTSQRRKGRRRNVVTASRSEETIEKSPKESKTAEACQNLPERVTVEESREGAEDSRSGEVLFLGDGEYSTGS